MKIGGLSVASITKIASFFKASYLHSYNSKYELILNIVLSTNRIKDTYSFAVWKSGIIFGEKGLKYVK